MLVGTLHWAYAAFISPRFLCCGFGPFGYPDLVPVWWLKPASALLALVPAGFLPRDQEGPNTVVQWMLYVLVVIPFAVVGPYLLQVRPYTVLGWVLLLVAAQALLWATTRVPRADLFDRWRLPERHFWIGIGVFSLFVYGFTLVSLGLDFGGFGDIADARSDLRETIADTGNAVILAVGWQSAVVNPLLIGYGWYHRRWLPAIAGLAGQVVLFGVTGFKSIAVSVALIAVIIVARGARDAAFGRNFIGLLAGGVVVTTLWAWVTGGALLMGLVVRRLFVVPGQLIGYYFEFFSSNPNARLGHSILSPFVDYPYDLELPYLIGRRYFGSDATHVNANVWSDGYANFGIAGVVGATLLLGLGLYLIDSAGRGRHPGIAAIVMAVPAFTVSASPLVAATAFNLIPAGIILMILPRFSAPLPTEAPVETIQRLVAAVRDRRRSPM